MSVQITACHNCGKKHSSPKKPGGVWCKINKVTDWFHTRVCFNSWNKKYKGKYEGGLVPKTILDQKQ